MSGPMLDDREYKGEKTKILFKAQNLVGRQTCQQLCAIIHETLGICLRKSDSAKNCMDVSSWWARKEMQKGIVANADTSIRWTKYENYPWGVWTVHVVINRTKGFKVSQWRDQVIFPKNHDASFVEHRIRIQEWRQRSLCNCFRKEYTRAAHEY